MAETIRTERLILRPLRASDAGPISLHCGDARVARMTAAIPHPYPPGAAQAFIEGTLKGRRAEEVWAIDATPSDGEEMIGAIGYQPGAEALGYWIGPPWWGSGYASEAVAALVAHLFATRGLDHIETMVLADNAASAAVLAKAGFTETGAGSLYSVARGEVVPCRRFRLDRAGWAALTQPLPAR